MKRLFHNMMSMNLSTVTYSEIYKGRVMIFDPASSGMPPYMDEDPVYYQNDIGYEIRHTHKWAPDKPTVTILIPGEALTERKPAGDESGAVLHIPQKNPMPQASKLEAGAAGTPEILQRSEGEKHMKRLKYLLQQMNESTTTYPEMYRGESIMHFPPSPQGHCMEPEKHYDPSYWHNDMVMDIEEDHKLAKDKPVITWHIPAECMGISGEAPGGTTAWGADAEEWKRVYLEAAADYCLRRFQRYMDELNQELYNRSRPDNENGKYYICRPGGQVLTRNASYFAMHSQKDYRNGSGINVYLLDDGMVRPMRMCLCLKLQVQLPAKRLKKAVKMLCKDLPEAVDRFVEEFDREGLEQALELAEKQTFIRGWLKRSEYCAFVANGSILPRAKGSSDPMEGAVPFLSVPGDEIEICGVRGMGIKKGVTVITGGGYSGKSTLLDAVSAGIYNHAAGDGRELCITDNTAVSISAEDGRSVKCVNISPFIQWLPGGDTKMFSTERASGSTSQAANIMEALDGGAGLLLIDEDRSATNFMIRDCMMKELIDHEPITPFTDRVGELNRSLGISVILVIGGSGEYLGVADKVYKMEDYRISDVTEKAKEICRRRSGSADGDRGECPEADWTQRKILCSEGFTSYPQGSGSERLQVSDMGFIFIGDERIDVRGLHDIVSPGQLDSLGFMLRYLEMKNKDSIIDLRKRIDELYDRIYQEGMDFLYSSYFITCRRFLELPRKQELLALINRMRKIQYLSGDTKKDVFRMS